MKNKFTLFVATVAVALVWAATLANADPVNMSKSGAYKGDMVQMLSDHETLLDELRVDHLEMVSHLKSVSLKSGALRQDGGSGTALSEVQNAWLGVVNGTMVLLPAGTNMPAISLNVASGNYGLVVYTVDSSGTVVNQVASASTLAGLSLPDISDTLAVIGGVVVNPQIGAFTGGTTLLEQGATTNVYHFDSVGAFDWSIQPLTATGSAISVTTLY